VVDVGDDRDVAQIVAPGEMRLSHALLLGSELAKSSDRVLRNSDWSIGVME
jgi:hypothetical protein